MASVQASRVVGEIWLTWRPVWIAAGLGLPLFVLAVVAGGAGHGTLFPLWALFPLGMLTANAGGPPANEVAGLVVALFQWPLYAGLMCIGARVQSVRIAAWVVAALHLAAMTIVAAQGHVV